MTTATILNKSRLYIQTLKGPSIKLYLQYHVRWIVLTYLKYTMYILVNLMSLIGYVKFIHYQTLCSKGSQS